GRQRRLPDRRRHHQGRPAAPRGRRGQALRGGVRSAAAQRQSAELRPWFHLLCTLANYRAGDDRGCRESAQKCRDQGGDQYAPRAATVDLLLAMSSQRLGEPEKAKLALKAGSDRIKNDLPALSDKQPLTGMN